MLEGNSNDIVKHVDLGRGTLKIVQQNQIPLFIKTQVRTCLIRECITECHAFLSPGVKMGTGVGG